MEDTFVHAVLVSAHERSKGQILLGLFVTKDCTGRKVAEPERANVQLVRGTMQAIAD